MFAIIGIAVVFLSIIGGFLMEKGKLLVLLQPSEMVIIGGAALGTLLIANPMPLVIRIFKSLIGILAGSRFTKGFYLESLKMLSDIFVFARKNGMAKLEEDVEHPDKSALLKKYPTLIKDHHLLHFVCDTLRTAVSGTVSPHDLDALVEQDIETHHHEISGPARSLTTISDALPGLGIVAAVLGVVNTMGSLGGPPEAIGEKVAAALVGTFLGIFLSYGFMNPLAVNMEFMNMAEMTYIRCIAASVIGFANGMSPIMAVEVARRGLGSEVKPTADDLESMLKAINQPAAK